MAEYAQKNPAGAALVPTLRAQLVCTEEVGEDVGEDGGGEGRAEDLAAEIGLLVSGRYT